MNVREERVHLGKTKHQTNIEAHIKGSPVALSFTDNTHTPHTGISILEGVAVMCRCKLSAKISFAISLSSYSSPSMITKSGSATEADITLPIAK